MRRAFVCVLLLSAVVYGQASPTFEVASIRPSSPQTNDVRAGVRIAGAQVRFVSMSLKDFIGTAYGVKPQQISGPDWLGQERFDLAATIPSDGSPAQIPQMMRALLADRFRLRLLQHRRPARSRHSSMSPQPAAPTAWRSIWEAARRSRMATTVSRSAR